MYDELIDIIKKNNGIVFFGGAGVSTESGIPDFRGKMGYILWNMNILLRTFCRANFLKKSRKNSFDFTEKIFCIRMQNLMQLIML